MIGNIGMQGKLKPSLIKGPNHPTRKQKIKQATKSLLGKDK